MTVHLHEGCISFPQLEVLNPSHFWGVGVHLHEGWESAVVSPRAGSLGSLARGEWAGVGRGRAGCRACRLDRCAAQLVPYGVCVSHPVTHTLMTYT
jgi:hypothetical protein